MNKKKMSKKKKIIIILSIILILIILRIISWFFFLKPQPQEKTPVKVVEVLDDIEGYGCSLEDRDTKIYKEKFLELKKVLEEDNIDYEKYAQLLAELFAIDLYTIDNKNSKYDVGSLDFIYPDEKEKFQNKVMDTLYKLVEDNSSNTRKQELPIVANTEITETKNITYTKKEQKLEAYEIHLNLIYEKDLAYDKKLIITLTKEENKIYIVSLNSDVK